MYSLPKLQRAAAMLALAFTLLPVAAHAQWIPAGITFHTESQPAPDPSGGFMVAGNGSITRFSSAGFLAGYLTAQNGISASCTDGHGGIICVAGGSEINVSRARPELVFAWSGYITANPGGQNSPACTPDGAGGAFVAWLDQRNTFGVTNTYDIYAQWMDSSGVQRWTTNGAPVCTLANDQTDVAIVSDGSGGLFLVWWDKRASAVGGSDIYAQHLNSAGAPLWAVGGIPICAAAGVQQAPVIASDGAGGFYASWWDHRGADYDIYLQRVNGAGTPAFAPDGMLVSGAPVDQILPQLVADGSNGVFIGWEDHRAGGTDGLDIYARRVDSSGAFTWPEIAVCTEAHQQKLPAMTSDGAGGLIIGWIDTRLYGTTMFVQRLDASGNALWAVNGLQVVHNYENTVRVLGDGSGGAFVLGSATAMRMLADGTPAWVANFAPTINSVSDVGQDEGGFVRLAVAASLADYTTLLLPVSSYPAPLAYEVWRKVHGSAASTGSVSRLARGSLARTVDPLSSVDLPAGVWEVVGTAYAHGWTAYSVAVPTHSDSTSLGTANDQFVVVTVTTDRTVYAASSVVSGHSVDNIAPPPPSLLAGGRTGTTTAILSWQPSTVADLARYLVYRGDSPSFATDPAHRIGVTTTPQFNENAYSSAAYYKVTAVDRHGNESAFSMLTFSDFTSVAPGVAPHVSYAAIVGANPFTRRAVIEYGLAHAGRVDLAIYDLAGRKVASLVDGERSAGVQHVTWEGAGASSSRLEPGVYLARFEAPGVSKTMRLVRVE